MHLQSFPPTRYVRGGASRAHKRDYHYQLLTKLKFRLPASIVWFYASSSIIWWLPDNFFSAECIGLLEKKGFKIINVWGGGGLGEHLGR